MAPGHLNMHCTGCLERILTGYHVSIPSEVVVISNFHFMLRLRRLRTQVRPEIASEQTVGAERLGRPPPLNIFILAWLWSKVYTPASHQFKSFHTGCFHHSAGGDASQYEAARQCLVGRTVVLVVAVVTWVPVPPPPSIHCAGPD